MKDYREITQEVLERSGRITAENRRRKTIAVRSLLAAGCLCAVLTAVVLWRHSAGGAALPSVQGTTDSAQSEPAPKQEPTTGTPNAPTAPTDPAPSKGTDGSGSNGGNAQHGVMIPADGSSQPKPPRTLVESFEGAGETKPVIPENGRVVMSGALLAAMEKYGESDQNGKILYRVKMEIFVDGKPIPEESSTASSVISALEKRGYIMAIEKSYLNGSLTATDNTLHTEKSMLEKFPTFDYCGIMLRLFSE